MLTVDGIAETFRTFLLTQATIVDMLPGGWLYDRQRQATTATADSTGYGVIRVDWLDNLNSSGAIYRHYAVTLAGYLTSNSQLQSDFQAALDAVLSFQPGVDNLTPHIPAASGSGLCMCTPQAVSQKVADEMKSGSDVTPVMAAWWIEVVDGRA